MNSIYNKNKKILLLNYKLFLILLLLIPLNLFNNIFLKAIGSVSIIILLMLNIFYASYNLARIKFNRIIFWFIIITFYNIILLLRTPTVKALYIFLLQVILLFLITILSSINLENQIISKMITFGKTMYFILLIPVSIIILEGGVKAFGRFNIYFSPVIYKLMLPCTFFFIPNSKHKFLKFLFFSFIFLRIGERTSAIVLIVIYIIYRILKIVKKSKILYNLIFILTFIIIIGFTYIYVNLQYMEIGYTINNMFIKYTKGNFFSGRNIIWEIAFYYINKAPILGYGLENNILHLVGIELSEHNTYIRILLQGGILGLLIFFMFLYAIWKKYFYYLNSDLVLVSASYLIGTLVFINFEVTLVGNTVAIAIFLWLIIGIGLIECNNKKLCIFE